MMIRNIRAFLVALALLSATPVLADEVSELPKMIAPESETASKANELSSSVNVREPKIVERNGNDFKLSFVLSNGSGAQPDVRYAVEIMSKSGDSYSVVDTKVYDEVLSLSPDEQLRKEISYRAPAYLDGKYHIWIAANNSQGSDMVQMIVGEADFSGSGKAIKIGNDCYLTIDGEDGNKKYGVADGVVVANDENLKIHCGLSNGSGSPVDYRSVLELRRGSSFGEAVSSVAGPSGTLASGTSAGFEASIPRGSEPGIYHAEVSFDDQEGNALAAPIIVEYVTKGQSAAISSLRLDKDAYSAGETAKVFYAWSGSRDVYPDARLLSKDDIDKDKNDSISISITSGNGEACADSVSMPLAVERMLSMNEADIAISADCRDPKISASIKDKDGKVLFSNDYAIASRKAESDGAKDGNASEQGAWYDHMAIPFGISIVALAIILIAIAGRRMKKTMISLIMAVGLSGCLLFFPIRSVMAATYSYVTGFPYQICLGQVFGSYCTSNFIWVNYYMSISIDKSTYSPGEDVIATGSATWDRNGYNQFSLYWDIFDKGGNSVGGGWSFLAYGGTGTGTKSAPLTPGEYRAVGYNNRTGYTIEEKFTVVNPVVSGACGTANGTALASAPAAADLCSAGTASAVLGSGPWTWTCAGSGGGKTVGCSSPVRQSPADPTCSGPSSLQATKEGNFAFDSSDPQGDNIKYQIDWDNDNSQDQESGWLANSNCQFKTKHSWADTGIKSYKAKACDASNNCSNWGQVCSVNITACAPSYTYSCSEPSCGPGECGQKAKSATCMKDDGCGHVSPAPLSDCSSSCASVASVIDCGACNAGQWTEK